MKLTWLYFSGGLVRSKFMITDKRSSDGEELKNILTYAMENPLKINKNPKVKTKDDSDSESKYENFNFKNIDIGMDYDSK